ncbi:hypothetical protein MKW98_010685, partial [Papaver atlanticum]
IEVPAYFVAEVISGSSGGRSGGDFCVCINGVGGGFWCRGGDSGGFLLVNVVFVVGAVDTKSRHFKTFNFISKKLICYYDTDTQVNIGKVCISGNHSSCWSDIAKI